MKFIQTGWHKVSEKLANTPNYFRKSPSNILQKQFIVNSLAQYASGTLLDVGAGRSIYRAYMPESVTYHALDYEKTEKTYSKEQDLDIVGDAQNMPIDANSYDTVLCSEVLEHIPKPHEAAAEIIRVLKPGGHAIITVPFLGYYHDEPYDFARFTKHGLKVLFESSNVEIVEQRGLGGLFSFLGYIRSTIILAIAVRIPIVWNVVFVINYLFAQVDIFLDALTKNGKLMPLTNVLIIKKK